MLKGRNLLKRRRRDGTIEYVIHENKDARIKRLEALLKEVTETLAEVVGYGKPVAAAATYDCYK